MVLAESLSRRQEEPGRQGWRLAWPFRGKRKDVAPSPLPPTQAGNRTTTQTPELAAPNGFTSEHHALIERWMDLPREIIPYKAGVLRDGTPYPSGSYLTIGGEQVMDTFEIPWVQQTVDLMWRGRTSSQDVAERGFGMGLMAEANYQKMRETGGSHTIIELNKQVYGDATTWAVKKLQEAQAEGRQMTVTFKFKDSRGRERSHTMQNTEAEGDIDPENKPIELKLIHGDADEKIVKFLPRSFNLIFSDTHQLRPEHMGINDLLRLNKLKLLLKRDGKFTFCAFHRRNQGARVDNPQSDLILKDFKVYHVDGTAEVLVPPHNEYLEEGRKYLPIVICRNPRLEEPQQPPLFA